MSIWLHRSADAATHQNRFQKKGKKERKKRKKAPGVVGGRERKASQRIRYLHKTYKTTCTPNKARRHSLSAAKMEARQLRLSDAYHRSASKCFPTLAITTRRRWLGIARHRSSAQRSAKPPPAAPPPLQPGLATHSNVSVIS